jgi:uncharacterized protein YqjF (DUF2071 family)
VHPAFSQTDHRPWPLPGKAWSWQQVWLDLVFIHFEADAGELKRQLPHGLELELFEGKAWIGIVPFRMEGVTKRGWPAPAFTSDFPEINVRTYVTDGKKPGVWFLSLDAGNRLAVTMARVFFHLPYFHARMSATEDAGRYHCASRRTGHEFVANYRPGEMADSRPGSFAHWATARYCLYAQAAAGALYRGEIQHPAWPLQQAEIEIQTNTLADVKLGAMHPAVLFSKRVDVVVWPLERIN